MAAARQFAARRPAQQRLGVVFFNRPSSHDCARTRRATRRRSSGSRLTASLQGKRDLRRHGARHTPPRRPKALGASRDRALGRRRRRKQLAPAAAADAARTTKTRVVRAFGLRSRSYDGFVRCADLARHGRPGTRKPTSVHLATPVRRPGPPVRTRVPRQVPSLAPPATKADVRVARSPESPTRGSQHERSPPVSSVSTAKPLIGPGGSRLESGPRAGRRGLAAPLLGMAAFVVVRSAAARRGRGSPTSRAALVVRGHGRRARRVERDPTT